MHDENFIEPPAHRLLSFLRYLMHLSKVLLPLSVVVVCEWSPSARALEPAAERRVEPAVPEEGRLSALSEAPVLAFTHSAWAPAARMLGAAALGSNTFAISGQVQDEAQFGGGVRIWGSPLEHVTLIGEGLRRDNGEFAPALTLQVGFWQDERWALGALGRFKSEGFAEIEGEIEAGLLASYDGAAVQLDINALVGRGFDEEETDGELALRATRELSEVWSAGVEGRVRYRLTGDLALLGGRSWDIVAGPQLSASFDHLFASLLTGPSTVGVVSGVGWESLLTVGGTL